MPSVGDFQEPSGGWLSQHTSIQGSRKLLQNTENMVPIRKQFLFSVSYIFFKQFENKAQFYINQNISPSGEKPVCNVSYSIVLNRIVFIFIQTSDLGTEPLKEESEQSQCETLCGYREQGWSECPDMEPSLWEATTFGYALHKVPFTVPYPTYMGCDEWCIPARSCTTLNTKEIECWEAVGKIQALHSPLWASQNQPHRNRNKQQNCRMDSSFNYKFKWRALRCANNSSSDSWLSSKAYICIEKKKYLSSYILNLVSIKAQKPFGTFVLSLFKVCVKLLQSWLDIAVNNIHLHYWHFAFST